MDLPPQVTAIVRLLRRDLLGIREAIQKQHRAEHNASEANEDKTDSQHNVVVSTTGDKNFIAEVHPNDPQGHAIQKSIKNATWFMAWSAFFAFIAAGVYAGIAAFTYRQILKSTNAAATAAGAASAQVKLMRQEMEGTLAAVVNEEFEIQYAGPTLVYLSINLLNHGHFTARQVQGTVEWQMIELPSGKTVGKPHEYNVNQFDISAVADSNQKSVVYKVGLSPRQSAAIDSATLSIRATSNFTYLDNVEIFPRVLRACRILLFLRVDKTSAGLLENSSVDCVNLPTEYQSLMQRAAAYRKKQQKTN
jgi:hypothetical protein